MTERNDFDQLRYWIEKTLERHEDDLSKQWVLISALQRTQDERSGIVEEWKEFQKDRLKDSKKNALTATVVAGGLTALVEIAQRLL